MAPPAQNKTSTVWFQSKVKVSKSPILENTRVEIIFWYF